LASLPGKLFFHHSKLAGDCQVLKISVIQPWNLHLDLMGFESSAKCLRLARLRTGGEPVEIDKSHINH
jgi:hypothetical protein